MISCGVSEADTDGVLAIQKNMANLPGTRFEITTYNGWAIEDYDDSVERKKIQIESDGVEARPAQSVPVDSVIAEFAEEFENIM